MTERERWIVYPLLFLALGAGLRDQLFDVTTTKRIVCQQLAVVREDRGNRPPVPLVEIGSVPESSANAGPVGAIEVAGDVKARTVYADNFVCRGIPFGPTLLRAIPGISPSDWFRAMQQSAKAVQEKDKSSGERGAGPTRESEVPSNSPPDTSVRPTAPADQPAGDAAAPPAK